VQFPKNEKPVICSRKSSSSSSRLVVADQIIFGGKGIKMLVSIIIIKLVISLIIMILLFLFNLRLCFKTENLFGALFGELDKCI